MECVRVDIIATQDSESGARDPKKPVALEFTVMSAWFGPLN